jgi:hypothetical protein
MRPACLRSAADAVGIRAMRDEQFAGVSDAALRLLSEHAAQELRLCRAQEERALREIMALRDEMLYRLQRRGDEEGGAGVREPRGPGR